MSDRNFFVICYVTAVIFLTIAINATFHKMNDYEEEHNCRYVGFGLCEPLR